MRWSWLRVLPLGALALGVGMACGRPSPDVGPADATEKTVAPNDVATAHTPEASTPDTDVPTKGDEGVGDGARVAAAPLSPCEQLCGRAHGCMLERETNAAVASHLEIDCLERCTLGSADGRAAVQGCERHDQCAPLMTCLEANWDFKPEPGPAPAGGPANQEELLTRWCAAASRCVDKRREPDPKTVDMCVQVLSSDQNAKMLEGWLSQEVVDCYANTCADSCMYDLTLHP